MAKYADVVLPLPIGETFTYALPASLQPCAQVGCSVIVPFGNRKMYSAIIVRLHDDKPTMPPRRRSNSMAMPPWCCPPSCVCGAG